MKQGSAQWGNLMGYNKSVEIDQMQNTFDIKKRVDQKVKLVPIRIRNQFSDFCCIDKDMVLSIRGNPYFIPSLVHQMAGRHKRGEHLLSK